MRAEILKAGVTCGREKSLRVEISHLQITLACTERPAEELVYKTCYFRDRDDFARVTGSVMQNLCADC